jgi:hypothetical protein
MNRIVLAACAATLIAAGAARADSLTLHGDRLVFTSTTDEDASIEPDTSLHGAIRISADNPSCLVTHEASEIVVDTSSCGGEVGHVTIDVPENFKLTVAIANSGNVTIGNTGGDLTAALNGSGDLRAGRVAGLVVVSTSNGDAVIQSVSSGATVNSSSNGDVRISDLKGVLHSRQVGSGDLIIGHITAGSADISLTSDGDAVIGKGRIGALRADLSGGGDLAAAATVDTADLNATGGGDIRIARVTGPVQRHASGGSSISTNGLGLSGSLLSKLASVGTADITGSGTLNITGDDGSTDIVIGGGSHHGSNAFGHFVTFVAILFLLFVIWRAVQRRGGFATVKSQIRASKAGGGEPTHPGVIAIRDKLAELDAKLARVESYVTNREFELHRKFRELDTQ